jgi:hypothetical protein
MAVQHGYVAFRFLRVVSIVRPGVNPLRFRAATQIKNLHNTFPYRSPLERFFHWHTLNMRSFSAMQASDYVPKFFYVIHGSSNSKKILNPVVPAGCSVLFCSAFLRSIERMLEPSAKRPIIVACLSTLRTFCPRTFSLWTIMYYNNLALSRVFVLQYCCHVCPARYRTSQCRRTGSDAKYLDPAGKQRSTGFILAYEPMRF